jgi:hypothetical protein
MKLIVNGVMKDVVIKPGHKCYKLRATSDKIEVSIVTVTEHADGIYCSALNLKNAIKKFNKMITYAEANQAKNNKQESVADVKDKPSS